ncbi:Crp/Fnr family transcriptional regulator [Anaerosporobacter sp.]
MEVLRQNGQLRLFSNGDVICREDETGKYVYFLLKGEAKIYKKEGEQQTDKHIGDIQVGTIFGESTLIESKKRNASVIASSDNTVVLEVENEKYNVLLQQEPKLGFMLLKTLVYRINLASDQLLSVDPAHIFNCRTNDIYMTVSSLDNETFREIVNRNSEYTITALKELSEMLETLDKKMLS